MIRNWGSISFLLIHVGSSSNFWLSLWPVLSFFLGNFCHFLFNWNFLTTASLGCGIVPRRLGRYIFFWNWVLLAGFSYLKNSKNSEEESLPDFGNSPQVLACSIYIGLYGTSISVLPEVLLQNSACPQVPLLHLPPKRQSGHPGCSGRPWPAASLHGLDFWRNLSVD